MAVLRDAMTMMKCEMMHKILPHCPSIFPMVAMMGGIIPCSSAAAVMLTMSYRMQSSSNNCIGAYLYLNPLVWPGGPPLRPCQGKGQRQRQRARDKLGLPASPQPTHRARGQSSGPFGIFGPVKRSNYLSPFKERFALSAIFFRKHMTLGRLFLSRLMR